MAAHPLIFRCQQSRVSSHLPAGWYTLVDKLCADIEAILSPAERSTFEVLQIKEKFAALRFYFRFGGAKDTYIDIVGGGNIGTLVSKSESEREDRMQSLRELVEAAMQQSSSICETCGESGEIRNLKGYFVALCDRHSRARGAKK
jgi:hypothetical protein